MDGMRTTEVDEEKRQRPWFCTKVKGQRKTGKTDEGRLNQSKFKSLTNSKRDQNKEQLCCIEWTTLKENFLRVRMRCATNVQDFSSSFYSPMKVSNDTLLLIRTELVVHYASARKNIPKRSHSKVSAVVAFSFSFSFCAGEGWGLFSVVGWQRTLRGNGMGRDQLGGPSRTSSLSVELAGGLDGGESPRTWIPESFPIEECRSFSWSGRRWSCKVRIWSQKLSRELELLIFLQLWLRKPLLRDPVVCRPERNPRRNRGERESANRERRSEIQRAKPKGFCKRWSRRWLLQLKDRTRHHGSVSTLAHACTHVLYMYCI